ncbi:hypothetical protein [Brevibacillus sp. SYSU BS000544]|uniref:hypothetical protein n=1 Tax=Brevibacillus sp. SYSU BS000544 TaxID=3416443 RepID=UPI003CE482A6
MIDLKEMYLDMVQSKKYMNTTKSTLLKELKIQAIEIGYLEIVFDFFLDIQGYDLSKETLRKVYRIMMEHFQNNGEWISTDEAKLTKTWSIAKQKIRLIKEF